MVSPIVSFSLRIIVICLHRDLVATTPVQSRGSTCHRTHGHVIRTIYPAPSAPFSSKHHDSTRPSIISPKAGCQCPMHVVFQPMPISFNAQMPSLVGWLVSLHLTRRRLTGRTERPSPQQDLSHSCPLPHLNHITLHPLGRAMPIMAVL